MMELVRRERRMRNRIVGQQFCRVRPRTCTGADVGEAPGPAAPTSGVPFLVTLPENICTSHSDNGAVTVPKQ